MGAELGAEPEGFKEEQSHLGNVDKTLHLGLARVNSATDTGISVSMLYCTNDRPAIKEAVQMIKLADVQIWTHLSVATAKQETTSRYSIDQDSSWRLYEPSPFRLLRSD